MRCTVLNAFRLLVFGKYSRVTGSLPWNSWKDEPILDGRSRLSSNPTGVNFENTPEVAEISRLSSRRRNVVFVPRREPQRSSDVRGTAARSTQRCVYVLHYSRRTRLVRRDHVTQCCVSLSCVKNNLLLLFLHRSDLLCGFRLLLRTPRALMTLLL